MFVCLFVCPQGYTNKGWTGANEDKMRFTDISLGFLVSKNN